MIDVNDIKNGMTIIYEGNLYQVLEFLHVKPGKGPAFMRTKLKNLRAGSTIEKTFNTNVRFEKANINKISMQFLYSTGDVYNFMNMETYEQVELSKEQLGDDALYLKEGLNIDIIFFNGEVLGIMLPEKIEMKVIQTDTVTKGNTTNNAQKEAVLETGLVVKVPLFIDQDEVIVISTSTGKYDSRA